MEETKNLSHGKEINNNSLPHGEEDTAMLTKQIKKS